MDKNKKIPVLIIIILLTILFIAITYFFYERRILQIEQQMNPGKAAAIYHTDRFSYSKT